MQYMTTSSKILNSIIPNGILNWYDLAAWTLRYGLTYKVNKAIENATKNMCDLDKTLADYENKMDKSDAFMSLGRPPQIFIAHSMGLADKALKYAAELEQEGYLTYVPARDTKQDGGVESSEGILYNNLKGIVESDELHVLWDGSSYGTIFDIGSAYALNKPIKIIEIKNRTWHSYMLPYVGKYLSLKGVVDI